MQIYSKLSKSISTLFCLFCFFSSGNLYPANKKVTHDDFILNTIPKAGTHLMMKCIHEMTGKGIVGLTGGTKQKFIESLHIAKEKNAILKCHHYSGSFLSVLYSLGYKNIFMIRDPRDACVSFVKYMDSQTGKRRDFFNVPDDWDEMSFDEKLYTSIVGKNCESYVKHWYERLTPWSKYPGTLVVKFEDLVGANGGGDDFAQLQTIINIAVYTNMNITHNRIEQIAKNLYSPTLSEAVYNGIPYTPGQIGNWKLFFSDENKAAFKKRFNHLLIQFGYESSSNW